jgi:proteasome lid subunit RPN8/RPN11
MLWDICDHQEMRVIGDIHTHPGHNVSQSSIDRANPMIARSGHIALIAPHLATRGFRTRDIGVHEYSGDSGWRSWHGTAAGRSIRIRRFR